MRRYPENDEWNFRPLQGDETIIAEAQLVYVARPQRGQSLGSVLMTTAALEAIADPRVHISGCRQPMRKSTQYYRD